MALYGRDTNRVLMYFESGTFAVPSGTSGTWIGLATNHDLNENENYIEIRYAGTNNRNFGQQVPGPRDYDGTLTYYLQHFRMLPYVLGSCVDTSGTVSYHVISELNSDGKYFYTSGASSLVNFPSFTIEDSKKGQADGQHYIRTINGCVADKFVLKAEQGKVVEIDLSYKGQTFTLGSKATQISSIRDQDSSRPYVWSDVVFQIPAATSMNELASITYSIDNAIAVRHFTNGSRVAQAFVPTSRTHVLELTCPANTIWGRTLNDYHKNGSIFNASLILSQSATKNGTFTFSGCEVVTDSTTTQVEGVDDFKITIRPQTVSFIGSDNTVLYNPW
jgi:hypothetical protein